MSQSAEAPPRTLADQLRGWSDEQLSRLLRARPDLATPTPQDTSQLASRLGTRASVLRAVDQLTQLELTVVDALLALGGTASAAALRDSVHADPEHADAAVARIRELGLAWGTDDSLRALSVLTEVVGTKISRLGSPLATLLTGYGPARVGTLAQDLGLRPTGNRHDDVEAIVAALSDRDRVARLVAALDPQARAILEHLEREGKDGVVESTERSTSRGPAGGPVEQLLTVGLVVARDRRHVAVPREVAIALRGGRTTRDPADVEPVLATSARDQALVDRSAGGAAFELVRHLELLLEHWGTAPPSALRAGGLGVRDLKATAELLHMDERNAALHVEIALAAELLAVGEGPDGASVWLPTDGFDLWSSAGVADRWARVAQAWLESPRLSGLVGGRENGKPVERPGGRPGAGLAAGDPADRARGGRGARARHRAGRRHRHRLPGRPDGLAAATAPAGPRPGGAVGGRGVRRRRGDRTRRAVRPRPEPARPRRPGPRTGAAAALTGRPRAAPGRPDRGGPGPPRAGPGPQPRHRRRHRVPRRRHRLPVQRGLGPPGLRLGLVGGRGARLRVVGLDAPRSRRR